MTAADQPTTEPSVDERALAVIRKAIDDAYTFEGDLDPDVDQVVLAALIDAGLLTPASQPAADPLVGRMVSWADDDGSERVSRVVSVDGDYVQVDHADLDNPGVPTTNLHRDEVEPVEPAADTETEVRALRSAAHDLRTSEFWVGPPRADAAVETARIWLLNRAGRIERGEEA